MRAPAKSNRLVVRVLLGGVHCLVVRDVGDEGGETETESGEQVPEPMGMGDVS